eukprot:scaffold122968_cov58-Phaeocystis_antarctica.AAC.4
MNRCGMPATRPSGVISETERTSSAFFLFAADDVYHTQPHCFALGSSARVETALRSAEKRQKMEPIRGGMSCESYAVKKPGRARQA